MTDQYCETLYWEDVAVGEKGPELVVENIERKDFVRFAGATGDFNPMHYDDPAAKAAGHPSAFGPGMLTGGFGAHMLCGWFGIENVRSFSVRFTDRVWPGDTVTVTGEVTEKDDDDGVVEAEFEVSNQDGKTVVTGTATAALPSRDTG